MCTLSINKELNGIELIFEAKPAPEILTAIKAAGFHWHNLKKLWYAKQTPERMELAQKLSGEAPIVTAPTAAPDEIVSKYGIKAGDIFVGSWGYNMTIVEFYKVTKIISPCRVEIIKIGTKIVKTDCGGGEYLKADPDVTIGKPIQKNVVKSKYSDNFHIKINNSCDIRPWDGELRYQNTWD